MLNTQFAPWPSFTQEEAEAVQKVLLSNKVNYWQGVKSAVGFYRGVYVGAHSEVFILDSHVYYGNIQK